MMGRDVAQVVVVARRPLLLTPALVGLVRRGAGQDVAEQLSGLASTLSLSGVRP